MIGFMSRHTQGVLLITLSTVFFSSAGFFTRLIPLDVWTMLFWRGVFAGAMILGVVIARERGNTVRAFRAIGGAGLVAAACSTGATVLYINAFRRTSVADVAVIFAIAPFLTAALGWLCLGVRETWSTLVASLIAVACMAVMMLIIRHRAETPMLPAACLSALLCPVLVWPVAAPFSVGTGDMMNLFLFGTTQFGLGLLLLTIGGQMVSATENALLNTLETPLAIAWVWFAFAETPSASSLIGGVIVLAAVAGNVWRSSRTRLAPALT
jgi:drug/metabolite transporter (DMT)-like permease